MKKKIFDFENKNEVINFLNIVIEFKLTIFKIILFFCIIGLVIGFISPNLYTATSTFLPQTSKSESLNSIGGLAALAGLDLGSASSSSDIPASLYPNVLYSIPFKREILMSKIFINSDSITYKDYLLNQKNGFFYNLRKRIFKEEFKIESESQPTAPSNSIIKLTEDEIKTVNMLEDIVLIETNEKVGYVSLKVIDKDPFVAAQIAKNIEQKLQNKIIDFRIQNSKSLYNFTEEQLEIKKNDFFRVQEELAYFVDRNQNVTSSGYLIKLNRLQAEFDLANTIYSELAKQKEQAAIQLNKDTPIFTIIEEVSIPNEKSSPNRLLLIIIFGLIGLVVSIFYILLKKGFFNNYI